MKDNEIKAPKKFAEKHPVLVNAAIIIAVAIIGIWIVYFSLAIFTKHGKSDKVPGVENMSYTEAINVLHEHGFKVDIRDSLYKDNIRPGFVIEQFPKANSIVKPGRKIFLYINAVHPKEVVIDDDNHPMEDALRSFSFRSGMARLQELGFKNIKVAKVLGANECIVKILANGRVVKKMQKVPVNALITVQVSDGRLEALRDSLRNEEMLDAADEGYYNGEGDYSSGASEPSYTPAPENENEPSGRNSGSQSGSGEESDLEFF